MRCGAPRAGAQLTCLRGSATFLRCSVTVVLASSFPDPKDLEVLQDLFYVTAFHAAKGSALE
jgi:hypothetical protein